MIAQKNIFAFLKCKLALCLFFALIVTGLLFNTTHNKISITKVIAAGATHYVDGTLGSDDNSGLSESQAWKTISKVNSSSFNPGDSILFKRGQTWRELLDIPSSGSDSSQITFGAYGDGPEPIISGDHIGSIVPEETGGIFASGFENETSAMTSSFDGKVEGAGNAITVTDTIEDVNYGSSAMKIDYGGSSGGTYAHKSFDASTDVHIRLFFRFNPEFSMPTVNNRTAVLTLWDSVRNTSAFMIALTQPAAGSPTMYAFQRNNTAGVTTVVSASRQAPGMWHMLELHWKADATAGGSQVWIDGISVGADFTQANSNYSAQQIRLGGSASGTGSNAPADGSILLFDDVKVSSTGPIGNYVTNRDYAIDLNGQSNITIEDLRLQRGRLANINLDGRNSSIANNVITESAGDGILISGENSSSNTVLDCSIHRNKRHGVYWQSAAEQANNNTISRNKIYLNQGTGIEVDNDQTNNLITFNTIDNNVYGINSGADDGFTIRNNIISRSTVLELNAGANANLAHDHNAYWQADASKNLLSYGGSSYNAATLSTFEPTAISSNPRPEVEESLGIKNTATWLTPSGSIFTVADSKFQKSTDGGITWTILKTLDDPFIAGAGAFVDSRGNIYLSPHGGTQQGLWRSTDEGESWSYVIDLSDFGANAGFAGEIDEDGEGNLYAGLYQTAEAGNFASVYKSIDGGENWVNKYTHPTGRHVHGISVDKTNGYVYAVIGDQSTPWNTCAIVRSVDGGDNWTTISPGYLPQMYKILAGPGYRLITSDDAIMSSIWKTTDDITWEPVLTLPRDAGAWVSPWIRRDNATGKIYAPFSGWASEINSSTLGYLYSSSDNGDTWQTIRIFPVVPSKAGGPTLASNIVDGNIYLTVAENGMTANGARYSITYDEDFTLSSSSPIIGAASDGSDIGALQFIPQTPSAPTLSTVSTNSIRIVINKGSNPDQIKYAIYNQTTSQYVQANGSLGSSVVWQTYDEWGEANGIINTGLQASTAYTYVVKAIGTDNLTQTSFSSTSSTATHSNPDIPSVPNAPTTDPTQDSSGLPTVASIVQTIKKQISQASIPIVARFTAASSYALDSSVFFDATESFSSNDIADYLWDFGDGQTSVDPKTDHHYLKPGRYTVTLTVTDNVGNKSTISRIVDILPPKPTISSVTVVNDELVVQGEAYPETIVYLTIHSDPIESAVTTDSNGKWKYVLSDASKVLNNGNHTVYARATYVLIDGAELTSEQSETHDFLFSPNETQSSTPPNKSSKPTIIYIVILAAAVGTIAVLKNKKRRR